MLSCRLTALARFAWASYGIGLAFAVVSATAIDLAPKLVGRLETSLAVASITVAGSRAYWTSGFDPQTGFMGTLHVGDVSNPTAPRLLGSLELPRAAGGIAVSGDFAYVAVESAGLIVVKITDPAAPVRWGAYNTSGSAYDVVLVGNLAYVADGEAGLVVVDVTDPASPRRVGSLDGSGEVHQVAVSGHYAYLTDRYWAGTDMQPDGALRIVDVTNPASPRHVGRHRAQAGSVAVVGNTWITDTPNFRHTMEVLDAGDPRRPRLLGTYVTTGYTQLGSLILNATGEFAFLALGSASGKAGRVDVVNLRTPSSPVRIASHDFSSTRLDQAIRGEQLLVGDGMAGLTVLDIRDPSLPVVLGSHEAISWNLRVATFGSRAFLSGLRFGFQIVDVNVPARISLLGSSSEFGFGWNRMAAAGHLVFAAAGGSGLQVVDTRSVSEPVLQGANAAVLANDLAVSGEYVLVAADEEGLQVFGVEPRSSPAPSLAISRATDAVAIRWSSSTGAFTLQSRDLLAD
ncbi:MAG: hypothetical protein JNK85_09670, partial [Verrucomicrobiales bacterium]|nr:hypothetical protein [Verrucomicrobiales bacterium]